MTTLASSSTRDKQREPALARVCVVGCGDLHIDLPRRSATLGTHTLSEGDVITLDGETGCVYAGVVPVIRERPEAALADIARWQQAADAATS